MQRISVFNRGQSQVDSVNASAGDFLPVNDAFSRRHSVPAKNRIDVTRKIVEIKAHNLIGKCMLNYEWMNGQ